MKKWESRIAAVLAAGLMVVFGGASNLSAQGAGTDEFMLEEITVTAQKREENQQKVPIAMDVITGNDLSKEGRTNVDEILSNLSNVFINTNADGMRVSIRGLADYEGTVGGVKSTTPTVAVNIDGAQNDMASAGFNLFDLERVEVLYGPQSTMYSSNSPGGIVNVVTASPKTDKYSASASYQIGNYDLSNIQAMVNVPIVTDKLALRLAGSKVAQGNYVEGATPTKNKAVRLKTLWAATDDLSITVTGNWSEANSGGMMGGNVKPFVKQGDDTYPDGSPLTDPWTADDSDSGGPGMAANSEEQVTKGLNANISWDSAFGTLTVTPSYTESKSEGTQTGPDSRDGMGPDVPDTSWDQHRDFVQEGGEVRMASSPDFTLFTWIVGGTYYNYENNNINTNYANGREDIYNNVKQENKAAFANITYPLWFYDTVSLNLGYRRSWDTSSHASNDGPGSGSEEMEYSNPDYKIGFQWDAADSMMVYGSYATSYRVDAMGSWFYYDDAIKEIYEVRRPAEENKSYSLGLKSRFMDNRLQFNTSVFYYDYRNSLANGERIVSDEFSEAYIRSIIGDELWDLGTMPYNPSNPTQTLIAASMETPGNYTVEEPNFHGWGDMRSFGVDVAATWVVTSRDIAGLSVSYLDSKWTDLYFDYMFVSLWEETLGHGDLDCSDMTAPNTSEWSITANYEHTFDLWQYGTLTPRVDMQYRTGFNMTYNTDGYLTLSGSGPTAVKILDPGCYYQEDYTIYNASIDYQHPSGYWSLNVAVKNITDYAVKKSWDTMSERMMIGDPRTYTATLSVRF